MPEIPLKPFDLIVKRGAAKILRPRFTALPGTDISTWLADFVVKKLSGADLFSETSSITTEPGTPNIGSAEFIIPEESTPTFGLGPKQVYYIRLRDTGSWNDIVLHGNIIGIIVAGGA